jgi:hypothetical protein
MTPKPVAFLFHPPLENARLLQMRTIICRFVVLKLQAGQTSSGGS